MYLFDSFEGLSDPNLKYDDNRWWKKGDFRISKKTTEANLKKFKNFKIFSGYVPYTFKNLKLKRISFLHIDVDLYQPTLDSLTFFYNRILKGGVIVFDDYGFKNCIGHKKAIDEFFKNKKEKIIEVPTGQAFVIKL